jgi:hypothetical protein
VLGDEQPDATAETVAAEVAGLEPAGRAAALACAINPSTAIPRNVIAKLFTKMRTLYVPMFGAVNGTAAITNKVAHEMTLATRYHFLYVSVVSAIGAQKNFHVCGNRFIATSDATTPSSIFASCAR